VVQLVGDFGRRGQVHHLPCPSEAIARARAKWWQDWRPDVHAEAIQWPPPGGVAADSDGDVYLPGLRGGKS
jgi:hypothetical protein